MLGLDDRAPWCEGSEEPSYRLVWRFGTGRTTLKLELAGRGCDTDARIRVLLSWPLLEELAEGHSRRLARALGDYANEDEYDLVTPELRVVV